MARTKQIASRSSGGKHGGGKLAAKGARKVAAMVGAIAPKPKPAKQGRYRPGERAL